MSINCFPRCCIQPFVNSNCGDSIDLLVNLSISDCQSDLYFFGDFIKSDDFVRKEHFDANEISTRIVEKSLYAGRFFIYIMLCLSNFSSSSKYL